MLWRVLINKLPLAGYKELEWLHRKPFAAYLGTISCAMAKYIHEMQTRPFNKLEAIELQRLSERSNARGLCHLVMHCVALFTCGWFQARDDLGSWPFAVLTFMQGILVSHLYMPFHESCHYTAFRSRLLCEAVANITGFIAGFNATEFRLP